MIGMWCHNGFGFYMSGAPKDMYCYILKKSFSSYCADFFFCTFWTPRTKKLQQKFCLCVCVCLMSECKNCHRPSDHSVRSICMKIFTLVYLCDTHRHSRRNFEFFFVFIGFFVFLGFSQLWGVIQTTSKSNFNVFYRINGPF